MEFIDKNIDGVYEIKSYPHVDQRGFFMRTFDEKVFAKNGLNHQWVQENHSKSVEKGVIRGIHLQKDLFAEAKLIRVISGEIYDVFIDLRKNSPTFGKWGSIILSESMQNSILIPRGVGHAFCTLSRNCEVVYKMDNYYSPNHAIGLIWNDEDLSIDWPCLNPVLSEKDKNNISFKTFINQYGGIKV